ncbi:MAG: AlpA family phage regulatory protein [Acidimicrobiaceae bacterium]|nr:AlpA family phage regulatory protein [Acidimicrobiaceae bacterium]
MTEILRVNDVTAMLNVSRRTLARWRETGRFPEALQLGPNCVGWRRADIDAWLDSRPAA